MTLVDVEDLDGAVKPVDERQPDVIVLDALPRLFSFDSFPLASGSSVRKGPLTRLQTTLVVNFDSSQHSAPYAHLRPS